MSKDMVSLTVLILIVLAVVVGMVLTPLAVIWALNGVFGLGIAYTWKTVLGVLILLIVLSGSNKTSTKR